MEGMKKSIKALIISAVTGAVLLIAVIGSVILLTSCKVNLSEDTSSADEAVSSSDEAYTSTEGWTNALPTVPADDKSLTHPSGMKYEVTQDWDVLNGINDEIKGWIDIPNTDINYPVLRHEGDGVGNQYYLHRNFDKSYLFAGSVFIDYRSKAGEKSRHIITHGHNMNNGSMYADLVDYGKYTGNLDVYKNAPSLFFHTEDGVHQWVIFSVYKTSTLERHGEFFNYLIGDFSSSAQYMNYIYNVRMRSLFDVPVPINENDRIMTLSTCSYEYTDFRTVVVARMVRPGEDISKYVENAQLNENPLWPEVYYTDHNVDPPEITTFSTEYSKEDRSNVAWYDGEGKLEGKEWLPGVQGRSTFTVSFTDCNGDIIKTELVSQGRDATPPPDPQRPSDGYYEYHFAGWQLDYTNVQRDMIITPSYTHTRIQSDDQ